MNLRPTPTTWLLRSSKPRSQNLVIVNKGPGAVTFEREASAWDLMEIYFMPADIARIERDPTLTDAEHVIFETDRNKRKFAIIQAAFDQHPFWKAYDAVFMIDDDVAPAGCMMEDIFELFAQTDCRIGQPALTHDSFYGHVVHLQNKNFIWRRTNSAELMCPLMTRQALAEYLPIFSKTASGFGLDDYWSFQEWLKGTGVAVLDQTPVRHSRRVGGGAGYDGLNMDEGDTFLREHGIPRFPFSTFGGVLARSGNQEDSLLGSLVSGYDRSFAQDPRFRQFIMDQTAICENSRLMEADGTRGDRDERTRAHRNVAATLLYMATKDFTDHRGPVHRAPAKAPSLNGSTWDRFAFWR